MDPLAHAIAVHDAENAPKEDYMGAFPKYQPRRIPQTSREYIDELREGMARLRAKNSYLCNVLRSAECSLSSCDDAEAERVSREIRRILNSFDGEE